MKGDQERWRAFREVQGFKILSIGWRWTVMVSDVLVVSRWSPKEIPETVKLRKSLKKLERETEFNHAVGCGNAISRHFQ
jgi:hypothetical protein